MPTVIDGVLVPPRNGLIPVTDDGLLRGDGVFEVVRLYAGKPWALVEHLERMEFGARKLRLPFSLAAVREDIATFLGSVGARDAFMRVLVTRGGQRIVLLEEIRPSPVTAALVTIEHTPSPILSGIKSLSYAANMLAARLAVERDGDDALLIAPDGQVLEASRASFFYSLEGVLCTPPLDGRILDSITRRHLIEVTGARERLTTGIDLDVIAEAFIASTTKEVLPIRAIDGRCLPLVPGPLTVDAGDALDEHIRTALNAS